MVQEVKRVRIEIDSARAAQQLRKLNSNLSATRKSAQNIETAFRRLNSVLSLAIGGTVITNAVGDLIRLSDAMQELSGRVALFASDTVGVDKAMSDLADTAILTYSSFQASASAYARLGVVTKEVGVTHNQLITIVQGLNDALRISGASTKEAQATMLQFSQALGSGVLQGDEFRSFAESAPRGLKALADALNVNVGALKEMSKQGELTRDVLIDAFITQAPKLRAEAEGLPVTVGRAWENVRTTFSILLADFEKGVGIFGDLAEALDLISKALLKWNRERENERVLERGAEYNSLLLKQEKTYERILQLQRTINFLNERDPTGERLQNNLIALRSAARDYQEYGERIIAVEHQIRAAQRARRPQPALPSPTGSTPPSSTAAPKPPTFKLETLPAVDREKIISFEERRNDILGDYVKSVTDAQEASDLHGDKLKRLIGLYQSGAIEVETFRKEFKQLVPEWQETTKEVEKTADAFTVALGQTMANAVDRLGDSIADFALEGKGNFKDLANSIVQDIARMMIKFTVMQTLFGGQTVGSGGGLLGGFLGKFLGNAKGNAFSGGNVIPFARGGVVSRPTLFPMANGAAGLMGEKGPEAVMPLMRDGKGRLGVSGGGTVVNITNNTGAPVEQQVSNGPNGEEIVNIVVGRVASEIMTGGPTARAIEQSYGVRRAGYHR